MWHRNAFLVLLVCAATLTGSSASSIAGGVFLLSASSSVGAPELEPVWVLTHDGNTARVTHNRFSDQGSAEFPTEYLILRSATLYPGERRERIYVSLARFGRDGEIEGMSPFVPSEAEPTGDWSRRPRLVTDVTAEPKTGLGEHLIAPARILGSSEENYAWFQSPDGQVAVLSKASGSFVVELESMTVRHVLPYSVFEVAFATQNGVFAALGARTIEDDQGAASAQWGLLVVSLDDGVEFVRPRQTGDYTQLYFTADGQYAIVTAVVLGSSSIEGDDVLAIDVHSGQTITILENVGGFRYHSDDGARMAVVQGGWGKVLYYDTRSLVAPALLWVHETPGVVGPLALNHDGNRVAFTTTKSVSSPVQVRIVSGENEQIGVLKMGEDMSFGLMFFGSYLFAGVQSHLLPAYVYVQPTKEIRAYQVP